jgi:hypothetical protein
MSYAQLRPSDAVTQNLTSGENQHPLEAFFGPYRGTHEKLRADDALSHESFNLPKSYEGKNRFLEDVLDFKIRKEDEFYTSRLMPWEATDQLHVAWEIFTFNKTIAELEPHQGIPRYVTAQTEKHSDNLLRRGLAFLIEHGFYKTERGKRHFAMNLSQIQNAVQTTCYFGVIHALLGGQNYYKEWQSKFGQQVTRVSDLMDQERRRWAIVQKSKDGLYILDAELKHELRRENVNPNIYVWPDKMGIYANMVGEHNLSYHERGPLANENRERGDQKTSFRGTPVFEAQAFDVEFTGRPIDLMTRERQCGEWFYLPAGQEIAIYDGDRDNWAVLTHNQALLNQAVNAGVGLSGGSPNQTTAWDNKGGISTLKSAAVGQNPDPTNDLLIFRPHQTYEMASCILAQGGSDLGNTFHGHHDFLLSDDIVRKVHVGHFTFYSKSIVKNPKNYVIVEDVFCRKYIGGEGSGIFSAKTYKEQRSEGTLGKLEESLILVAVPKGTDKQLDSVLDVTGRFHPSVYEQYNGKSDTSEEHYPNSQYVFGALGMQQADPFRQTSQDEFLNRVQRVNTVCFRGHTKMRKLGSGTTKEEWKVVQHGEGHWGPNVYAGVKKVRNGAMAFIEDQGYKVELA